jgi:glycosyltransferase involved in cell wall biosynthesis
MELASVVVYPYHSITQSGALQAAYAFGKPVVATNVGGFPEAVEDGKNGFLVPPRSPRELAIAISKIINDPLRGKEMGAYSKHLSETRFAWEPIAGTILDVYSELLKNK